MAASRRPKLTGIGVEVKIKADHRRPVPARAGGQHRVEHGRRLVIPPQSEEAEHPELVQDRIVGVRLQGQVGETQGAREVSGLEGVPRGQERRIVLLGAHRHRKNAGQVEGPAVIRSKDRRRTVATTVVLITGGTKYGLMKPE